MDPRNEGTGSPRHVEGAARRPRLARRTALVLATAALATGALAAPARADTTIGQTGGTVNFFCFSQQIVADTTYVVPSGGGTITSFSYQSVAANDGDQLDFLALRPAGGSNYTVVGKTGLVTLAGTGGVETFAANIAVQGGDIIGFWHPDALQACARDATGGGLFSSPDFVAVDPSVGDTVSLTADPSLSLNASANLVTTPPPTIADLIDSVEALELPRGTENALVKKLDGAQKNHEAGDTAGACDKLGAFIAQVQAQSGKKIDADDADDLIAEAEAVRASLGCA